MFVTNKQNKIITWQVYIINEILHFSKMYIYDLSAGL